MTDKIKGAVFDMDGTLVDSLMLWDVLWERLGDRYPGRKGFRPTEEQDRAVRTMTLKDAMDYIHHACGIGENGAELLRIAEELIGGFYENEVGLKDGVLEFLTHCKEKGIPMCIASATARPYIEAGLRHCGIDGFFPRIFSCAEIGKGKDEPDIFLAAAEFLGTSPEETWIFEDSFVAVRTAHNAGMKTVGIFDRYNFNRDELAALADVYIAEGETLKKLIF